MKTLEGHVEKRVDHEKANEYLELNKAAGEYFKKTPTDPELPENWEKVDSKLNTRTNFKGVVYKNNETGEHAVAYLGTDVKSPKDWKANVEMADGKANKQCKDAVDFYNEKITQKGISPEKVTLIGNSEAGREVVEVIAKTDAEKGVTFNGFLKVDEKEYPPEKFENLVNYRTKDDIISKCGKTIGTDYIVPVKEDIELKPGYKAIQSHRIDNIGHISDESVIPAVDYEKTTGERFKNKYGEGTLKSYEVGEIPKEVYPWVDGDVNEKLAKGEVENAVLNETKYNPAQNQPSNEPLTINNFDEESFRRNQEEKLNTIPEQIMNQDPEYTPQNPTAKLPYEEEQPQNQENEEDIPQLPKKINLPKPKITSTNKECNAFIWVAEGESCEICESLDGTIFEDEDEIPGMPHPNCDCQVKAIRIEDEDEDEDEEEDSSKKIKKRSIYGEMIFVPETPDTEWGKRYIMQPIKNEKMSPPFSPEISETECWNRYIMQPTKNEKMSPPFRPEISETEWDKRYIMQPERKKYWHEIVFTLEPKVRKSLLNRTFGLPQIIRH